MMRSSFLFNGTKHLPQGQNKITSRYQIAMLHTIESHSDKRPWAIPDLQVQRRTDALQDLVPGASRPGSTPPWGERPCGCGRRSCRLKQFVQIQANHPCLSSRAKTSGSIARVYNLVAITRYAASLCDCGAAEGKSGAMKVSSASHVIGPDS